LAPYLLILDEAFEGLAPVVVKRFREAVMTIKGMGIALLIAESNLTSAAAIADRLYVVDRGEILFQGTPQQAMADEEGMRALRGGWPCPTVRSRVATRGRPSPRCSSRRQAFSSPRRAPGTSCRSIPHTIRMRSRSRRWRPSAQPTCCARTSCTPISL